MIHWITNVFEKLNLTLIQGTKPDKNIRFRRVSFNTVSVNNLNLAIKQKQIIYAFIYKRRLTPEGLFTKLMLQNGNAYFPDNNICF